MKTYFEQLVESAGAFMDPRGRSYVKEVDLGGRPEEKTDVINTGVVDEDDLDNDGNVKQDASVNPEVEPTEPEVDQTLLNTSIIDAVVEALTSITPSTYEAIRDAISATTVEDGTFKLNDETFTTFSELLQYAVSGSDPDTI